MGTAHFLKVGNNMGMFVVIIATKVSRTAQEAATCAPLMGFLIMLDIYDVAGG
jgi:hypothetical protein